jgi:MFS family permease
MGVLGRLTHRAHGASPPTQASTVVRTYFAIVGLYTLSASLIWGVNTLFLLEAGLDLFEAFVANAAFTAGMVLFEIPTGVVADTSGRRLSFLLGAMTILAGTLAYVSLAAMGGGLLSFVVASIVLGLGFSFYSGAVEAWLVDALKATGFEGQLDRIFARGAMVSGAAMLVGTVGGGLLGSLDLAWPYLVRALLLAIVFGVAMRFMRDIGFQPHAASLSAIPAEAARVLQDSLTYGWNRRSVRLLMVTSFLQGGFVMWGFYAWQPYFLELLGKDVAWVAGIVAALIALSTIAGNSVVELVTRFCGKRTTLLLWSAGIMAAGFVGVGVVSSFWPAVLLLLVATGSMGVGVPVKQAYLHEVIPTEQRATVISFDSLVGSAGSVGGQLGLGYVGRAESVAAGYVIGGVALFAILPAVARLRRLHERADIIVGRRAGRNAACAGQGLPEVSAVDTTPRQPVPSS